MKKPQAHKPPFGYSIVHESKLFPKPPDPKSVIPTDTDKAYAAGFYDNCGYFVLSRKGGRGDAPRMRLEMRLGKIVRGTVEKSFFWFFERWGGALHYRSGNRGFMLSNLVWHLSLNDMQSFLSDIEPHSVRKRDIIRVVLSFQKVLNDCPPIINNEERNKLQAIIAKFDRERALDRKYYED